MGGGDAVPPRRALRPRPGRRRRRSAPRPLHRHVEQAGLRIVNGTAFASRAEVVVGRRARRSSTTAELREATQAALRGRDGRRRRARRPLPHARRALAGHRRGRGGDRGGGRASSRRTSASRRPPIVQTALDRLGPGPRADGRRPRRRGPRRRRRARGSTGRWCSPARRPPLPRAPGRRRRRGARQPGRSRARVACPLRVDASPAPHREPERRRRPGAGRAARGRGGAARARRPVTVQHTTGIEHAQSLAAGAAQAGEVAVSYGGDGLAGAVAHALRGTQGTLGLLPGGRGNDFARKLGIPLDARRGVRDPRARRRAHGRRRRRSTAGRSSASRASASTPRCRTSRTARPA